MMTKEKMAEYLSGDLTINAICRIENTNKISFRYWMYKYGLKSRDRTQTIDLKYIGKKFGKLFVESFDRSVKKLGRTYHCLCECGNRKSFAGHLLASGHNQSCGCIRGEHFQEMERNHNKSLSHIGETHYRLTILGVKQIEKSDGKFRYLHHCRCSCGNEIYTRYEGIIRGRTKSCGCWRNEMSSKNAANNTKKGRQIKWYFIKNDEKIACRSSYEVVYANYLIDKNISFEYEPETFKFGKSCRYTPDFWLKDNNTYIEIKGWESSQKQIENREKFKAQGNSLTVLVWADLLKLGETPYKSSVSFGANAKLRKVAIEDYVAQRIYRLEEFNRTPKLFNKTIKPIFPVKLRNYNRYKEINLSQSVLSLQKPILYRKFPIAWKNTIKVRHL